MNNGLNALFVARVGMVQTKCKLCNIPCKRKFINYSTVYFSLSHHFLICIRGYPCIISQVWWTVTESLYQTKAWNHVCPCECWVKLCAQPKQYTHRQVKRLKNVKPINSSCKGTGGQKDKRKDRKQPNRKQDNKTLLLPVELLHHQIRYLWNWNQISSSFGNASDTTEIQGIIPAFLNERPTHDRITWRNIYTMRKCCKEAISAF